MIINTSIVVVIPTHGSVSSLGSTLESLANCVLPECYRETIVVENGVRYGNVNINIINNINLLNKKLNIRHMYVERANKSYALNEALATVDPTALAVFFDDDVVIEPGTIMAYARALHEHPSGAFFGGPLRVSREVEPEAWMQPFLPTSARGWDGEADTRPSSFLGANWAARVRDVQAVGGFDPDFGPGSRLRATGQELMMQMRLLASGMNAVVVPGAVVTHEVPSSVFTPEWVIMRMYRGGVERGLRMRKAGIGPSIRELRGVVHSSLAVAKRALLRDTIGRHVARATAANHLGYWRGYLSFHR